MASTWGEPEISNSSPMQGPQQISDVADFAMARGIRHFDTVLNLRGASGALVDYYAVVAAVPGALWRYNGTAWVMVGTAQFATATDAANGLPTPVAGMRRRIATKLYDEEYIGSAWRPNPGVALLPILPASINGTGAALGPTGAITLTACPSVSLNGCFTSDFDNYAFMLDIDANTGGGVATLLSFRSAGVNDTTNYAFQLIDATAGSVSAASLSPAGAVQLNNLTSMANASIEGRIFNPARPKRTRTSATTSAFVSASTGIHLETSAGLHDREIAYDGATFSFNGGAGTATGTLRLYGYNN